jgi:hypothetical protein
MPAIMLSKVGSHRCDRESVAASCDALALACTAVGSIADIADLFIAQGFFNFH